MTVKQNQNRPLGPENLPESVFSEKKKKGLRAFAFYEAAALFVLLFGRIYTHFGYGVTSVFMDFAFLFPLGGGLLYLVFSLLPPSFYPCRSASRLLAYSLAAFTLDFLIRGILEIAGAFSDAEIAMLIAGGLFALAALTVYLVPFFRKGNGENGAGSMRSDRAESRR